ncbi:MAG: TonB-dependent receptor [Zoogloeaceae bacterium]|nr:TonB-dependent receptor [Zoogloeaceae bacterium]
MSSLRLCFRAVAAAVFFLAVTFAHAAPLDIDLPAQALTTSIQQLSLQSGLSIGGDASLLEGRTAPAVKGNMEPADALRQLLQGSGLSVSFEGNQAIIGSPTPVLVIKGARDGSAEAGYAVKEVKNFGFWGDRPQKDMPYTTFILSEELMENTMAVDPEGVSRLNPFTFTRIANFYFNQSYMNTRGYDNGAIYIEGIRVSNLSGNWHEDKSNVEIKTGASGFLYGMGGTGGIINYSLKRPTREYTNKVNLMGRSLGTGYVHADVGGPIPFVGGFRLNVAYQDGETNVEDVEDRKKFVSSTFDFRPINDLTFLTNISYGERKMSNYQGGFGTTTLGWMPKHVPSGRHMWGPDGRYREWETWNALQGMDWKVTDWFSLRAGYNYKREETESLNAGDLNFLLDGNGNLSGMRLNSRTAGAGGREAHGYGIYATFKVDTFAVKNTFTLGSNGYSDTVKTGLFINPANGTLTTGASDNTVFLYDLWDWRSVRNTRMPDLMQYFTGRRVKTGKQENYNFLFGDEITFMERFTIFAGINRSKVKTENINATTRAVSGEYDEFAWTPTFSLLYKLQPQTTVYATYIEALDPGQTVGATYANAGEVLMPYRSEQYETGVKHETSHGALLSLALFHLDKASQYSTTGNIYGTLVQDGHTVSRGVEASAQGRVLEGLTLMSGFTYLDTEITKTQRPTKGKEMAQLPRFMGKLYAEWDVPFVKKGLVLIGGGSYNGKSWLDNMNTERLSHNYAVDLGARYKPDADTTFRLMVTNVTNEARWITFYPQAPRALMMSASFGF